MDLVQSIELFRPRIEQELKSVVSELVDEEYSVLRSMLSYHLGWEGEGAGTRAQGKRIRPVMLLLCTMATGGDWQLALPAAAGVELLHNFSLIHDDVEDGGETRHGRQTVWVKWGVPQAINTGDLMFTLANLSVLRLDRSFPAEMVLACQELFQQTCIKLTQGQFLDMWYEAQDDLPLTAYWSMVAGKTAALMACCAELGSMLGGADEREKVNFRDFGHLLGMAFQVQDDYLGIWGEADLTGKSTSSDLFTRKKTLPVLYGLQRNGRFAARWQAGNFTEEDIPVMAHLLEEEGGRDYARNISVDLTDKALSALDVVIGDQPCGAALGELASQLLGRQI